MIEFEKIIAIDHNPRCRLLTEEIQDPTLQIYHEDWVQYFSNYLVENYQNVEAHQDHWVPSPLSSHILFSGFLQGALRLERARNFSQFPFQEVVPTPVRIPLKSGDLAVSFAEWICPVNCVEPETCPAIQAPRSWDMKPALENYFAAQRDFRSAHVLQCRHLAHGVGTIPMSEIFVEFKKLLANLEAGHAREVLIATTSACHGLISVAAVAPLQAEPKSHDTQQ
jgi:hypothetical protein